MLILITILVCSIIGHRLIIYPRLHLHKVSNKAWNGALEENSISEENMLTANLTLVLMAHHCKIDQGEVVFSAEKKPKISSCYP